MGDTKIDFMTESKNDSRIGSGMDSKIESGSECLTVVARIYTDYKEKFGIPRQSGLVSSSRGEIHLEGRYRSWDGVRGVEEFSHLWLLWGFSENKGRKEQLTAAPPRLGGRERRGVFATRSPYRPNGIGLSCVRLVEVRKGREGEPVLIVSGADLLDGTPIYDIKPYLPYTDAHPEAAGGFGEEHKADRIRVEFPQELREKLPEELRETALEVLAQDPRAAYQKKPDYRYGLRLGDYDIRFVVSGEILYVKEVIHVHTPGWQRIKEGEENRAEKLDRCKGIGDIKEEWKKREDWDQKEDRKKRKDQDKIENSDLQRYSGKCTDFAQREVPDRSRESERGEDRDEG